MKALFEMAVVLTKVWLILGVFLTQTYASDVLLRLKMYEHGEWDEFVVVQAGKDRWVEHRRPQGKVLRRKLSDQDYQALLNQRFAPLVLGTKGIAPAEQCADSATLSWSVAGVKGVPRTGERMVCLERNASGRMARQLASRMDTLSLGKE